MDPSTPKRQRKSRLPVEHSSVEFLFLADHAESLNGKLYVMGGGWDQLATSNITAPAKIAIACGVQVPWGETDDDHTLTLEIADADGNPIAPVLEVGLKTGRSPQMVRGSAARVPFAIQAEIQFPSPGSYVVIAVVDGRPEFGRRLPFHVRQAGAPAVSG